nr:cytochrome ubiquinol oxidase subunit I [Brevibacillus reuszeri]
MEDIVMTRAAFGTTMAFHIIFATLGVGLPLMILLAEILFWRTKDPDYETMAKRWTKAQAILLGVAIPSGTIAGVQLSLLWPGFMEVVGKVISLPFQIEIFAFFLEALFMSIYVYAAHRLSPAMRFLSVFMVLIGATASAILITNVHAFEGTPTGFRITDGEIVDVNPWAAFFNPSFFVTAGHVTVSAYMTGAFAIAGVAAWKMLRAEKGGRVYTYHQKALLAGLIVGGTFSLLTALNGHESAQLLHRYQPEKLAAAEGLFETQAYAPLAIGGFTDPQTKEVKYAVEIPWALSFLAANRFDEVVVGLDDFPQELWPPLYIHTLFNGMVGIGSLLIVVGFLGFAWKKLLRRSQFPRWVLRVFVASGPLALLGIEFGWIFACTGRQPWVIYRVMKTADAATHAAGVSPFFWIFLAIYLFLGIVTLLVFRSYFGRHPLELEPGTHPTDQPAE